MKKIVLLALALISLQAVAQKKEKIKGNREVLIKRFGVPSFTQLEVGEKFEIYIRKATDTTEVVIETDDNLFDVIHFNVENDVLRFNTSKEIVKKKRLRITVFVTDRFHTINLVKKGKVFNDEELVLDQLKITSIERGKTDLNLKIANGVEINASDKSKLKFNLKSKSAKINMHNSSSMEGMINVKNLDVHLDDHASCTFEGVAHQMLADIQNKADLNFRNVDTKDAVIKAADKSSAKINASGNLVLKLSGDSETTIYNSPTINLKRFKDNAKLYKK